MARIAPREITRQEAIMFLSVITESLLFLLGGSQSETGLLTALPPIKVYFVL